MADKKCETVRTGLFSRLGGLGAREHMAPYDGQLDDRKPDPSAYLDGVTLTRRAEIIVTGDPSRVQELGDAVVAVQKGFLTDPKHVVDMRVTAFMDDCIHSTGWSNKARNVRNKLAEWHCYESETRFEQAFRATAAECVRRGQIDSVVIVANRFDEQVADVQAAAQELNGLKVFINALVLKPSRGLLEQFKEVTSVAKGHAVPVQNIEGVREAMPFLLLCMFPKANLAALPRPNDQGARQLAGLLAAPRTA